MIQVTLSALTLLTLFIHNSWGSDLETSSMALPTTNCPQETQSQAATVSQTTMVDSADPATSNEDLNSRIAQAIRDTRGNSDI